MAQKPKQKTSSTPPADILLEPKDWYLANWRKLPPLERPKPAAFDLADGCRRLRRVKARANEPWDWSAAAIPESMSREEGLFWLSALIGSETEKTASSLAGKIEEDW